MALLDHIDNPAALRALSGPELTELAAEIREFLVRKVCNSGGHLGSNLAVVELTMALHRVFDSPRDIILWDTGHQAYVHKMLTGRRAGFDQLRQGRGLSGYPDRAESPHDHVANSHASTALSYADGMARGFALRGETSRRVVAVVGDGALTGGMSWEALNNIGAATDRKVVIVLNDNGRSYAPTVGAVADHLAGVRCGAGAALFGALGLDYLGPVDGHDQPAVEAALAAADRGTRSVVVHCVTRKGAGYRYAEQDQRDHMHAVGVLDAASGRSAAAVGRTWTDVFADEIAEIAARRPEVVAVTGAMLEPVGFGPLSRMYPDRVVDVGIAEQHATTMAAGLAMTGMHPVVALYATFLNRAYDQLLMDVALHRLPVTFVLDRAGITGPDGPSHHGAWDLALARTVPGLRVAAPRDASTLCTLLREAVDTDGPTALRFPKSAVSGDIPAVDRIGGIDVLAAGTTVLIVSVGPMARVALDLAERMAEAGVSATVADPGWVLPVSPDLVRLAAGHEAVLTVEDGQRTGGVGAALALALRDAGSPVPCQVHGIAPEFLPHDTRANLLAEQGLTADRLFADFMTTWGARFFQRSRVPSIVRR